MLRWARCRRGLLRGESDCITREYTGDSGSQGVSVNDLRPPAPGAIIGRSFGRTG